MLLMSQFSQVYPALTFPTTLTTIPDLVYMSYLVSQNDLVLVLFAVEGLAYYFRKQGMTFLGLIIQGHWFVFTSGKYRKTMRANFNK